MAPSNSTASTSVQLSTHDVVFALLYSFIVIAGVPANCIIITIVRKTPSMHSVTNYLLMNLAIADLLTLLLCPGIYDFLLKNVKLQRPMGDLICKMFAGNASVPITINTAVLTVCTIAVERYLALVKPFQTSLRLTNHRVRFLIPLLWACSVLSSIPDLLTNTLNNSPFSTYPCVRPWTLDAYYKHKGFIIFTCVFFGFLPSVVVIFCYFEIFRGLFITKTICNVTSCCSSSDTKEDEHSKKQLFLLLLWLTIIFAVCSLPFSIFFLYLTSIDQAAVDKRRKSLFVMHQLFRFLLFSNSFYNPLIYAFQSTNYREGFKRIFSCTIPAVRVKRKFVLWNKQ